MTDRNAARGRARRVLLAGAISAVLAVGLAGSGDLDPDDGTPGSTSQPASTSAEPPSRPVVTSPADTGTVDGLPAPSKAVVVTAAGSATAALALLGTLPVQGRAPQTGYSRAQFGQAWSDDVSVDGGHNGCDTRNDVLRRDITDARIKSGTQGCVVLSGALADPYTGSEIPFLRGADTSDDVQVDHVVALSDAWQSGAQQLTAEQRQDFGNDPGNLQATIGWVNQQKGAGDAATWLPSNKGYRCTYVARQIEVKAKYRLWVKPAEKEAMARVLAGCGAVPPAADPTSHSGFTSTLPMLTPVPPGVAGVPAEPFQNCAAARAAGAAPVHIGDPGYSTQLDGDRDGIACE